MIKKYESNHKEREEVMKEINKREAIMIERKK